MSVKSEAVILGNFRKQYPVQRSVRRIAAVLAVSAALAGCASESELSQSRLDDDPGETPRPAPVAAIPGWTIQVSVEPSIVGPIVVSAGPIGLAPRNEARPWVQHELVFENRGDRRLQFADTATSRFIGPARHRRRLLAADEICGYTFDTPRSPIRAGACLAILRTFAVKPGRSLSQTVTLFKGLPGMERLVPGTYVFKRLIRFRPGRETPPPGSGHAAVLRIVYEIERAPG
jgi:hypothetical protein